MRYREVAKPPDPLPNDLAYPQSVFIQATLSRAAGKTRMVELIDGQVLLEGLMVNPGSNFEQTNVICLLNSVQVGCSPEAAVWAVTLEPKTLAFVPYHIAAARGDMITFLYVANNEPQRLFVASIMQWVFVEEDPVKPDEFVQAPAHAKIEDGCNFSTITESDKLTYGMPGTQKRGALLSLVFQTCTPVTDDELVRLIPIVDRRYVVSLPGEVWHAPVLLANPATVIPIDTTLLGDAQEFQIAVVPLVNSTTEVPDWWGWFPFTQAVAFIPPTTSAVVTPVVGYSTLP